MGLELGNWAYNPFITSRGPPCRLYYDEIQGANPSLKLTAIAPGKWWKMETILFARIFDLSVSS